MKWNPPKAERYSLVVPIDRAGAEYRLTISVRYGVKKRKAKVLLPLQQRRQNPGVQWDRSKSRTVSTRATTVKISGGIYGKDGLFPNTFVGTGAASYCKLPDKFSRDKGVKFALKHLFRRDTDGEFQTGYISVLSKEARTAIVKKLIPNLAGS